MGMVLMAFASAGHYTVSYSIDSCSTDIVGPLGTHWSDVYHVASGSATGSGTSQEPPGGTVAIGQGSAHSHGSITATFTWQGDDANDLPPPVAIVKETAAAGWTGTSGSCDNGLGNPATNTAYGQCSSGTTYWLKPSPGASFTHIVSPDASASFSGSGVPGGPMAAQVSVSYTATASPVRLALEGTVKDLEKHDHALIGRGVSGHVSMDGDALASQTNFSNYGWSLTGDTFKQYSIASDQSSATVTYLNTTDLSQVHPTWYYKAPGLADQTVTLQVNITVAGNALGWATLTCPVTVWSVGNWDLHGFTDGSVNYGYHYSDIHAGGPPDDDGGPGIAGMATYAMASTPLVFQSQLGNGQFAVVQLCQLNHDEAVVLYLLGPLGHLGVYFPDFRLDGSFPYDSTYYPANGTSTNAIDDSPSQDLSIAAVSVNVSDHWNSYLMFLPPGGGQWVPVARMPWTWTASASRSTLLSAWPNPPSGSVAWSTAVSESNHPTWTALYRATSILPL